MKSILSIFFLSLLSIQGFSQITKRSSSLVSAQFAGSVGFWSIGYHRSFCKEKIEVGLSYGHTPKIYGGHLHTLSVKFKYSPFSIPIIHKLTIEPIQGGLFLAQHFGDNLHLTWPTRYKGGYYWWTNSLRQHLYLSTQISKTFSLSRIKKLSIYFECNTNDLYLFSYLANTESLKIYDIVFFGIGIKAKIK